MGRTLPTGEQIRDDSLTGADVYEESLDLTKIPFSDTGFDSIQAQAAIVEAKEDAIFESKFFKIALDDDLTIPDGRSLTIAERIEVGPHKIKVGTNSIFKVT